MKFSASVDTLGLNIKIFVFCLALVLLSLRSAIGQTYGIGYTKYQRGDYAAAIANLVDANKKSQPPKDKVKILKLLGICEYLEGHKQESAKYFRAAIQIDPEIKIIEDEVPQNDIITFFEGIRSLPTDKEVPAATPVPPIPIANVQNTNQAPPPVKNAIGGQKVIAETRLKVKTNAANALVFVDGLFLGEADTLINVEPGLQEVEVQAQGYLTRKFKLEIKKEHETQLVINLVSQADHKNKNIGRGAAVAAATSAKKSKQPPEHDLFADQAKSSEAREGSDFKYNRDDGVTNPLPGASKSKHRMDSKWLLLLPFGVGQFQNRLYFLGSAFAATEIGLIYYANLAINSSKNATAKGNERAGKTAADGTISNDDYLYIQDQDKIARNYSQNATYAQIGFGIAWSVGVIQSLYYEPQGRGRRVQDSPKYGKQIISSWSPQGPLIGLKSTF